MRRAEYHKYLASREWALLKEQVRERSGGRCERCHIGDNEQTHHLTYERIGNEIVDDLLGVCESCHLFLSAKTNEDPAMKTQIFTCHLSQYLESAEDFGEMGSDLLICECGEVVTDEAATFEAEQHGVIIKSKCPNGHQVWVLIRLRVSGAGELHGVILFSHLTERRTLGQLRAMEKAK